MSIIVLPREYFNKCNGILYDLFSEAAIHYGTEIYNFFNFPRINYVGLLMSEYRHDGGVANVRGLTPLVIDTHYPVIEDILEKLRHMVDVWAKMSTALSMSIFIEHDLLRDLDTNLPEGVMQSKFIKQYVSDYMEWKGQFFMERA